MNKEKNKIIFSNSERMKKLEDTIMFKDNDFTDNLKNKMRYLVSLDEDRNNNPNFKKNIKYCFEIGKTFLTPFNSYDNFFIKKVFDKNADKLLMIASAYFLTGKYLTYAVLGGTIALYCC